MIEILLRERPGEQEQAPTDDIRRERQGEFGPAKDRLEGRVAPALRVSDWMNTSGVDLKIEDLAGKVVVLNFWATW
mgnify:CR=1 FL=1